MRLQLKRYRIGAHTEVIDKKWRYYVRFVDVNIHYFGYFRAVQHIYTKKLEIRLC